MRGFSEPLKKNPFQLKENSFSFFFFFNKFSFLPVQTSQFVPQEVPIFISHRAPNSLVLFCWIHLRDWYYRLLWWSWRYPPIDSVSFAQIFMSMQEQWCHVMTFILSIGACARGTEDFLSLQMNLKNRFRKNNQLKKLKQWFYSSFFMNLHHLMGITIWLA